MKFSTSFTSLIFALRIEVFSLILHISFDRTVMMLLFFKKLDEFVHYENSIQYKLLFRKAEKQKQTNTTKLNT